jgi:hypothetical protein
MSWNEGLGESLAVELHNILFLSSRCHVLTPGGTVTYRSQVRMQINMSSVLSSKYMLVTHLAYVACDGIWNPFNTAQANCTDFS